MRRTTPAKLPPVPESEIQRAILIIEGWTPPSTNRLLKSHWAVAHGIKNQVKARVAIARLTAPTPILDATGRRRVSVVVTVAGRGGLVDPDNIFKCLMDALTANRLIVDDSAAYVEIGDVRVERGKVKRTVIELVDIG